MASGFLSNGVDLDNIFQPRGSATPVANTGYNVAGVDLALRYAPRTTPPVPVTGFKSAGVDLNQIFNGIPATGFSYRFLNQGGAVTFKQISTNGSPAGLYPTGRVLIVFNDGVALRSYAYPGGIRVSNFAADTTGITYVGGITIPATLRNNIDNLWNDLPILAFPAVSGQIASGGGTFGSGGVPVTLTATCDVNNVSMASFLTTLSAFSVLVFSQDQSANTLSLVPVTAGDTEGLWTAITAAATLAGLYAGTNKVTVAPIIYTDHGVITNNGSPNPFSPTGAGVSAAGFISYDIPTLMIERF